MGMLSVFEAQLIAFVQSQAPFGAWIFVMVGMVMAGLCSIESGVTVLSYFANVLLAKQ